MNHFINCKASCVIHSLERPSCSFFSISKAKSCRIGEQNITAPNTQVTLATRWLSTYSSTLRPAAVEHIPPSKRSKTMKTFWNYKYRPLNILVYEDFDFTHELLLPVVDVVWSFSCVMWVEFSEWLLISVQVTEDSSCWSLTWDFQP